MLRGYKPPRPRCGNRVSNCKDFSVCLCSLAFLCSLSSLLFAPVHNRAVLITVYCFGLSFRTPVKPQTLFVCFIPVVSDGVLSFAGTHESRVLTGRAGQCYLWKFTCTNEQNGLGWWCSRSGRHRRRFKVRVVVLLLCLKGEVCNCNATCITKWEKICFSKQCKKCQA